MRVAENVRLARSARRLLAMRRPKVFRVPPEEYEENLKVMVAFTKSWGGQTVLATAPAYGLEDVWAPIHARYQEITRKAAKESGALLLDLAAAFNARPELFLDAQTDHCHFSRDGDALAASLLADMIVKEKLCAD
jgi:lysophospholipase L1-like esterase